MQNIEYIESDQRDLDSISFLWKKLNDHHRIRSPYHAGHFATIIFDIRKKGLLEKTRGGDLRLDIAKDNNTGKLVGFCISSITAGKQGEIDSIYIENAYRRSGIGGAFMNRVLQWMDSQSVGSRVIGVATGNEEVLPFYARFGFYPRATLLTPLETEEK